MNRTWAAAGTWLPQARIVILTIALAFAGCAAVPQQNKMKVSDKKAAPEARQTRGATPAGSQAQEAQTAMNKAEVLEEKAAPDGNKVPPTSAQIITQAQAQAVDPKGEELLDDAITCLARSIYWEARGTNASGMEAIANVVMNRIGHEGFPNTICGVVKQGQEQGSCQFSWWCDGRSDDADEDGSYSHAKEIARGALNRQLRDRTGGALYFHHRNVVPSWSTQYIRTVQVGNHIFYKPAHGEAK